MEDNIKMDLRKWDRRGVCCVLVGKSEGKRPLGRHRRRWKDNIKLDLRKWDEVTTD
jgi:hypothetical protein